MINRNSDEPEWEAGFRAEMDGEVRWSVEDRSQAWVNGWDHAHNVANETLVWEDRTTCVRYYNVRVEGDDLVYTLIGGSPERRMPLRQFKEWILTERAIEFFLRPKDKS